MLLFKASELTSTLPISKRRYQDEDFRAIFVTNTYDIMALGGVAWK